MAEVTRIRRQARQNYHDLRNELGIRAISLPAGWTIGDCLYYAIIQLFPDRLRAALGQEPDVGRLRSDFGRLLQADFDLADLGDPERPARFTQFFPGTVEAPGVTSAGALAERERVLSFIRTRGAWRVDMGDNTSSALALAYGLPMVLLGPNRPYDIGPAGPREAYVVYGSDHYTAGRSPDGQVVPADALYETPEQAIARARATQAPEDPQRLERDLEVYQNEFATLHARFSELINRSSAAMTSEDAAHGFQQISSFGDLLHDHGQDPSIEILDRAGRLYEQFRRTVENLLRFRPDQPEDSPSGPTEPAPRRDGDPDGAALQQISGPASADPAKSMAASEAPTQAELEPAKTEPVVKRPAPAAEPLPDGWDWLDRDRGLSVPVRSAGSLPGTMPALSSWRTTVPGADGFAFHPGTGLVVLADRTVIGLTDGWIRFRTGLLHRDSGNFISPAGGISMIEDPPHDARMTQPGDQMNAEDLGLWLGRQKIVDDPLLAPGWAALTDDGQSPSFRWNSEPDVVPGFLPPGLTRGSASGKNLRCLLDTLSQLTRRTLSEDQRGRVTTDDLAEWLKRVLPKGTQGYQQLMSRAMIDVTDVLPTFTESFGVRVQVFEFRQRGDTTADGTFRFAQDGIYVHLPQGSEHDDFGNPTPILHVYWSYSHFEPLFTDDYPVRLVLRQRLRATRPGVAVAAVLPRRRQYEQAHQPDEPLKVGDGQSRAPRRRNVQYHGQAEEGVGPRGQTLDLSTQRLGTEYHHLLRRVLVGYLGARTESQSTINLLADVLGEALGLADGPPSADWNRRITAGLAVLPRTYGNSYTGTLPGIDPAGLAAGRRIAVPGLIRAHAGEGSVTAEGSLYVITSSQGRDLSRLVGGGSDLVMFDRDQILEVESVNPDADGRLRIVLRDPGTEPPVPGGDRQLSPGEDDHPPATEPSPRDEGTVSKGLSEEARRFAAGNPWWFPGDDPRSHGRTRDPAGNAPTAEQQAWLNGAWLQVIWASADGDCSFHATVATAGQDAIRAAILRAARNLNLPVPAGPDGVAGLLNQAIAAAREALPEGRARRRVTGLPPAQAGGDVTGQQLRLFLAYIAERNPYAWDPGEVFDRSENPDQGSITWNGLVEALRTLGNFAEPYGSYFSALIRYVLTVPVAVLMENGLLSAKAEPFKRIELLPGISEIEQPYTIVLKGEHYLGTVRRRPAGAQAAAFANLPANAVAVNAQGVYMTVPGGLGAVEWMGSPQFFAADGEELGYVQVSQIRRSAEEVSFGVIGKYVDLPRVSGLVLWYMVAYSGARQFAVYDIVSERLPRILGRFGMSSAHPDGLDMRGDAEVVGRNAAAAAVADGWLLRIPRPETPIGEAEPMTPALAAGPNAAFDDLPPQAVAVHADGSYLTVPSGIGVIGGMDDPRVFGPDGRLRYRLGLTGLDEQPGELSLAEIIGNIDLSGLVLWYLAAHAAAPRITLTDVVGDRFIRTLAGIGMTRSGNQEMSGDTRRVARYAAAAATRARWILRSPDRENPPALVVEQPGERPARAAAEWMDQALAYLTGDPAANLGAAQQRVLIVALLSGLASPDQRWLALHLLRAADDDELAVIFKDAEDLLGVLKAGISPEDPLRGELEGFLEDRFAGGREELAAGRVTPQGQPAGAFTPELLHPGLAEVAIGVEVGEAEVEIITRVIPQAIGEGTNAHWSFALLGLSPVQRARAARWLTEVRVAVHAQGAGPPLVLSALDFHLDELYAAAARQLPADRLRQVVVRPPSERAALLRDALSPAVRTVGGQTEAFTRQVPGQAEDFAARLRQAYHDEIERYTHQSVTGRGRAEHAIPGNLHSMEHIGRIADAARQWTDGVFGHLAVGPALVPDRPGVRGNIHDQWADTDQIIAAMSPEQRRISAIQQLLKYLTLPTRVADVVREHHAAPVFDPEGGPSNDETQIISAVIDSLLGEPATIDQVLAIWRGWSGMAVSQTQDIWIQVFRAPQARENQQVLWLLALTLIHEYLHLLEHPQYQQYRNSLGFGTQAYNTLVEGVVTLLTEVVWSGLQRLVGEQAVREVIEGEYAAGEPLVALPNPADYRYASMAEVMRLIHVVGSVQNLYAAFFLGDVEGITGPIGLAVMGSPRAPLPAGEVAAVVARLNAMPEIQRQRLRISLFADATQEEIERLLMTEPGADVLAVWTDAGRFVGRPSQQPPGRRITYNDLPKSVQPATPGRPGRRM
jgi:hypothetical protein